MADPKQSATKPATPAVDTTKPAATPAVDAKLDATVAAPVPAKQDVVAPPADVKSEAKVVPPGMTIDPDTKEVVPATPDNPTPVAPPQVAAVPAPVAPAPVPAPAVAPEPSPVVLVGTPLEMLTQKYSLSETSAAYIEAGLIDDMLVKYEANIANKQWNTAQQLTENTSLLARSFNMALNSEGALSTILFDLIVLHFGAYPGVYDRVNTFRVPRPSKGVVDRNSALVITLANLFIALASVQRKSEAAKDISFDMVINRLSTQQQQQTLMSYLQS